MFKKCLMLLIIMSCLFNICCSSGSDDDKDTPLIIEDPPVLTEGAFLDSAVQGLYYETETQSGITDSDGTFFYEEGETVTFYIGGILLGSVKAQGTITPVDLVPGSDVDDPGVTNILRFLQSLDEDGDASNGIIINAAVIEELKTISDVDFMTIDLDNDPKIIALFDALNSQGAFSDGEDRGLVSSEQARRHMNITLGNLPVEFGVDDDGDTYSEVEGDCDDDDNTIYPGAPEICGDGIDQDCDGEDELCPVDPDDVDDDGDKISENEGDCDDSDNTIYPGAVEICGDGIDQDCDGSDAVCPMDPNDIDDDGDTFTENNGDCDDSDNTIYPGAVEICGDGIDQDCDGNDTVCPTDPNDIDDDGDTFTENDGDCDDSDNTIYPGAAEICGDGIDQDCNGSDLECLVYEGNYSTLYHNGTLDDLSGYSVITGSLSINNASVTDLSALEKLTSVGGGMDIRSNSSLTSLAGLDNLISVTGNLYISKNASLSNLEALNNLSSVDGNIYITKNESLTGLGLENVCIVGDAADSELEIKENSSLCNAEAIALRDQIIECLGSDSGMTVLIEGNNDCE